MMATDGLFGCLVDWMAGWMVGLLAGWLIRWMSKTPRDLEVETRLLNLAIKLNLIKFN